MITRFHDETHSCVPDARYLAAFRLIAGPKLTHQVDSQSPFGTPGLEAVGLQDIWRTATTERLRQPINLPKYGVLTT